MLNEKITRSQAMKDHPHGSFGPKRGARRKPARRVRSPENNIVTKGKNGTTATDGEDPRLVGPKGKRKRSAKEILKNYSAGPVGKLPDHTVYHDMGYLMAESLGLVSEVRMTAIKLRRTGGAPLTPKEAMRQRRQTQTADAKLKAKNKKNMGSGILSSRVSQSNKSGT